MAPGNGRQRFPPVSTTILRAPLLVEFLVVVSPLPVVQPCKVAGDTGVLPAAISGTVPVISGVSS